MQNALLKCLFYGDPGSGKTTLCGTAENVESMGPVLFLPVENGSLSLLDSEVTGLKRIPDEWPIDNDLRNFEEAYRYLKNESHPYKTVVIDNLSELQRLHVTAITQKGATAGKRDSMFDPQLKDFATNKGYLLYWIAQFRDLPMHLLVTAHKDLRQQADGTETVQPGLTPAVVQPMCGLFDVVGYLFTVQAETKQSTKDRPDFQTERRLLTEPFSQNGVRYLAKDRSPGGKLGGRLSQPTMPRIWSRLLNVAESSAD